MAVEADHAGPGGRRSGPDRDARLREELESLNREGARHTIRRRIWLGRELRQVGDGVARRSPHADAPAIVQCAIPRAQFDRGAAPEHSGVPTAESDARLKALMCQEIPKKQASHIIRPHDPSMEICPDCQTSCMKALLSQGYMVCEACGFSEPYLDATLAALPYGNDVEITQFTYKRSNHFNTWLLHIQGKEAAVVPDTVIDKVRAALQERGIVDMSVVTNQLIREILKGLRLRKQYEHVSQICARITRRRTPILSPEVEEKARIMFQAVQVPFELCRPTDRKNFLSYSYCLYKFLQLLREDEILRSFSLLKGRANLLKQDEIFQKICQHLNWEFVPSVLSGKK